MSSNSSLNNYLSRKVSLNPKDFLEAITFLYKFDEEISVFKTAAFSINTAFLLLSITVNIMCIIIFLNKKLRNNKFHWYLLTVAIFQLIFSLILFCDYIFSKFNSENKFLHDLNSIAKIIIDFILHSSDSCVLLLKIFLSLDRLYAVMNPLKIKEFFTHLHALSLILMSLTTLILLKILKYGLCEINISNEIHFGFCMLVSPLIFYTIPLIIILILNVLLVHKLLNYYENQPRETNEANNQEIQLSFLAATQASTSKNSMSLSINMPQLRKFCRQTKQNKKIQYFSIILSDIYSILTSMFYYCFNSVFFLFQLNFFYMETIIKIQILSSVFFNSNYFIYFFIHLAFNDDFGCVFKNYFLQIICYKNNEPVVVTV
jgi:hypothetical protein